MKASHLGWMVWVLWASTGCTNFHEVDPGRLYRSAQLNGAQLESAIETHRIKTVINLRGANAGTWWFDQEREVADRLNVALINIPMSAQTMPSRTNLLALLDAFEHAERPILIHCRAGADRTGEAVAIYRMDHMGQSRGRALEALTPWTLHIEWFHPNKRAFIRQYEGPAWARRFYKPASN